MNALLLLAALLPSPASAEPHEMFDLKFIRDGKAYHHEMKIAKGAGKIAYSGPLESKDGKRKPTVVFKSDLSAPDANGRVELSYEFELQEEGKTLLESRSVIYVPVRAGAAVVDCGGWRFDLGYGKGPKTDVETGNLGLHADITSSTPGELRCFQTTKPGSWTRFAAMLPADEAKLTLLVFNFTPGEPKTKDGPVPADYKIEFLNMKAQGKVELVPGKTVKTEVERAAKVAFSLLARR